MRRVVRRAVFLALVAGCGGRALPPSSGSPAATTPANAGFAADADASVGPSPDASTDMGTVFGRIDGAATAVPPPVPAGLTFRPCGSMTPLPELLGVDAAGEAVLLSSAIERGASLYLAALPGGQVVRSIQLDDAAAVLAADRQHVITSTSLVDLRSGVAQPLAPWASQDVLALSPSGDFAVAVEDSLPTEPSALDAVRTADGAGVGKSAPFSGGQSRRPCQTTGRASSY